MISSTTPYKLAEIIHDTWPQLYTYNDLKKNEIKVKDDGKNNTIDK